MRHLAFVIAGLLFAGAMPVLGAGPARAGEGLATLPSRYAAAATLQRLDAAIAARGFRIFAHIDHAAAAKEAGLTMPPATVVVFGNPKGGTPNFLKAPTLAIDLPLKTLVWQDADGKVFVSWNTGSYVFGTLFARHGLHPPEQVVKDQDALLAALAADAVR